MQYDTINLAHIKRLIVLNILKYKYCANRSLGMSRDHFTKNRKFIEQLVACLRKEIEQKHFGNLY